VVVTFCHLAVPILPTDSDRAASSLIAESVAVDDAVAVDHERVLSRSLTKSPSNVVATAIPQLDGCDPVKLSPLFDTPDPETLSAVFPAAGADATASGGADRVSFHYYGYEIVVDRRPELARRLRVRL
jgi:hypothetical protein